MKWRQRAEWAGLVAAEILLAVLFGWLLAPGSGTPYLELQERSDMVHRFVLVAEPLSALAFLLFAMLALVFAQFELPRRILHGLWMVALICGAGVAAYVVRFDLAIERAGLRGQFIVTNPMPALDESAAVLGPFVEDRNGPGVTSGELPGGGELVLDRRSLFLRLSDSGARWQIKRPGGWPAALLVAGEILLVALPSDLYDDDALLLAVELSSGRPLFEFHALGREIDPLEMRAGHIRFRTRRPAVAAEYLIDPRGPKVLSFRELPLPVGKGAP